MKILIISRGNSYPQREIEAAAKKAGHEVEITNYKRVNIEFGNSLSLKERFKVSTENGTELDSFDYIVPRGPLNYRHIIQIVAMYAKAHDVKMLNSESILNYPIFDKSVQYSLLTTAGIPIIPALVDRVDSNYDFLKEKFGEKFVYKYTKGATGIHVYKISSQKELDELPVREKRLNDRWYKAQSFWPTGIDYRVAVIGGKVKGAMKRTAAEEGEFRANYSLGGKTEGVKVTPELEDLAIKSASASKCDYAGVDVMYWEDKPYVLEVNRFFHFDGFDGANNTKIGEKVIEYLEETV